MFWNRILLLEIAKQLDDQGKGLSKTVADIKDANKRGALHFAAREGKTDVCKYLLEELKLDVDTQDEDGLFLMFLLCILRFVVLIFVHELVIALEIIPVWFLLRGSLLFLVVVSRPMLFFECYHGLIHSQLQQIHFYLVLVLRLLISMKT